MNTIFRTLGVFLVMFSFAANAQQTEKVEKALKKAVAKTKGSSITIPLMEDSRDKNKLAKAVGSSLDATLKTTSKMGLWSVQTLSEEEIEGIALSGSPFSSLMKIKGESARTEFEKVLNNQLEKNQVFELLPELEKSEVLDEITMSTLVNLDQNGSKQLDNIGS